jgi:hypothetical protein
MRALVQILKAFGADDTDLGKLLRVPGRSIRRAAFGPGS